MLRNVLLCIKVSGQHIIWFRSYNVGSHPCSKHIFIQLTANSSVLVVYHWCCSGANVLGCCTCTSTGQYVVHVFKQQSLVEIDHYFVAYFNHITAFEAL